MYKLGAIRLLDSALLLMLLHKICVSLSIYVYCWCQSSLSFVPTAECHPFQMHEAAVPWRVRNPDVWLYSHVPASALAPSSVSGIATALLHLFSFWKLSNFLHCRTTWGDLSYYGWYYLLLKPAQVWSWELWSHAGVLCEWAQQTPPAGSWPWEDTASPPALELVEECSNQRGLQLTEVSTLSLEVFVPFMLKMEKIIDLAKLGGFLVVISVNTLLKMLSLMCMRQPVSNDLKVTSPFFFYGFLKGKWRRWFKNKISFNLLWLLDLGCHTDFTVIVFLPFFPVTIAWQWQWNEPKVTAWDKEEN